VQTVALLSALIHRPTLDSGSSHGFDLALRSVTTAALAIGLVVAVIYQSLAGAGHDVTLVGWAGIVIGFYFGGHVATNGALVAEQAQSVAVARAEKAAAEAEQSAKGVA
jgi:hypothetical protein